MIRINLIAPEKPSKKPARVSAPAGAFQFYLLLILFGGGAAAADVGLWLLKTAQIKDLDKNIAARTARQKELQAIKDQVDALEAKRKTYQMKVDLIERLRREQSDPVHMLDEISKALPEFVWLKSIEQAGSSLKISGFSNGLTAVADFMSALQRSGWFPSVEMGQTKESGSSGSQVIEFALTATFKNPESAAREAAARAAATPTPTPTPGKGRN
jgi:type IV pilus assembly protein PilN